MSNQNPRIKKPRTTPEQRRDRYFIAALTGLSGSPLTCEMTSQRDIDGFAASVVYLAGKIADRAIASQPTKADGDNKEKENQ